MVTFLSLRVKQLKRLSEHFLFNPRIMNLSKPFVQLLSVDNFLLLKTFLMKNDFELVTSLQSIIKEHTVTVIDSSDNHYFAVQLRAFNTG